ncbi:MAG: response regulator transcription factor [Gemmatimonadaceae bacterium]|nr:response regulator transcription factor [Gemmatimonadaceae bacterium]
MTRILVVEDNADLAFGLQRTLEAHGYSVDIAASGIAALAHVRRTSPDLLVLDLMIPDPDGFGVLAQLRKEGFHMPVLILSARSEESDKVRGLRTGADDFVTKPFGVQELAERVHALLRRSAARTAGASSETFRIGSIAIDVMARRVQRGEETIMLSPREFDLLLALVRQPGVALSRATLLRDVWGHAPDIQTRTVDLHIAELRRKIEQVPHDPRHIITVFKTGYRFDP